MKHVLLPTLLAVALAGCASDPVQLESDTTYRVEWVDAQPLADGSHITITLGSDGRAYGSAGCNHWFASYSRDGDRLNFGQAGATRKMCAPELMEQEQRFLEALGQVQRWDVSGSDQLRLWPAAGKPIRLLREEG